MSSVLETPDLHRFAMRLDVARYHRLCESGILPEKTELLAGIVVSKMGKSPLHTWTVQFLADWLRLLLDVRQTLRIEQPLTLTDSEPEPDLAIVPGERDDFRRVHPETALLVIEVAITTQELDLAKAEIYAAAGIQEYWLVAPEEKTVRRFEKPDSKSRRYTNVSVLERQDTMRWAEQTLDLASLFPE